VLARPGADGLGEERDADAHQLAAGPLLGLLPAQLVVAGHLQREAHRRLVVAGVVLPTGLVRVRELLRADEVPQPQLGRVHAQLVGEHVDHPLDEVDGLGDPEGAGVRDAARRLVGVDAGDGAVRGLDVVRAGEDVEEAGRILRRLRGGVEGAVVGEHVGADGQDAAVPGGGDLAVHVVVAGERGGHEVFGAVLHPFHRPTGDDGADDRADVARIDADLVAEAAADVRRDDPDLVLGDAGDKRVEGAVCVRRLGGLVQRELAVDRVVVGDRAAGLHRRRVRARIHHVLGGDHVRAREDRLGRLPVAGLPVEDVVVGPALDLVAHQRRVRVERPAGLDHRRQHLVVDVDQLERVARGVPVVGDDKGDLLALEAHLVGGEHRLHVRGQRRRPGEVERLEVLAGDDRVHLRVRERLGGVDRHQAGVRHRRAQDRAVQHAGQHDVVEVVALAADEARVLLAGEPAETDRSLLGGGHDDTSSLAACGAWRAAHCTERTIVV
jgi:hypothetical protein